MKTFAWIAGGIILIFIIAMLGMGYVNLYLVAK